jgi:large subunit ribosomal protein L13
MKRVSTYFAKNGEVTPSWQLIDATGQTLGRLASRIVLKLSGKEKVTYTPNAMTGDFVVVINAGKVKVTGRKPDQKTYYHHTLYVGNLKEYNMGDLLKTNPDRVIKLAVKGMLPSTKAGREMLKRLKVYAGPEHEHQAQLAATSKK